MVGVRQGWVKGGAGGWEERGARHCPAPFKGYGTVRYGTHQRSVGAQRVHHGVAGLGALAVVQPEEQVLAGALDDGRERGGRGVYRRDRRVA